MFFKKQVPLEVSYFAGNIYETDTVTSVLCYVEDLIFLGNYIVWFWNSLNVQLSDSSVELHNVHFHIRTPFLTLYGKKGIVRKKL